MVFLPRLLQNIEEYYNSAIKLTSQAQGWSMPDDPEPEDGEGGGGEEETGNPPHFDELMDISSRVGDPGLTQQLQVLAELYKRAIQIGGGYSTIAKGINNLKNMYSDGSGSDIEFILNGMIKELTKHAGGVAALTGNDNPRFIQQLGQLKQDIEARNQENQSEALDAYQEEVNMPGAQGEGEGELAEAGLEAEPEAITPAALGFGGDRDDPKANRGWHTTGKMGAYKNWSEYYNNEKEAYEADLVQEKNPSNVNILKQLISLLSTLSTKTGEALKLSDELKVAPNETESIRLEKIRDDLRALKKSRTLLKSKIRSTQIDKEQQKLSGELGSTKDWKEKELIKQKMALNELSKSSDIYKAKERNYRISLVNSMSGGNFPGPSTLQDLLDKIEKASREKITVQEYRKRQAKQVADTKKTIRIDPEVRKNVYNWAAMELDGFITHLSQNILAERKTAKDRIIGTKLKNVSEEEKKMLKPYMDAVANAANSKDKSALLQAAKELREQAKKIIRLTPEFTRYLISIRSSKFFYTYRDRLNELKRIGSENKNSISGGEVDYLNGTIELGNKLITYYKNLKIKPLVGGKEYTTGYKVPTETIEKVNKYLENILLSANKPTVERIDPETGEVTYE